MNPPQNAWRPPAPQLRPAPNSSAPSVATSLAAPRAREKNCPAGGRQRPTSTALYFHFVRQPETAKRCHLLGAMPLFLPSGVIGAKAYAAAKAASSLLLQDSATCRQPDDSEGRRTGTRGPSRPRLRPPGFRSPRALRSGDRRATLLSLGIVRPIGRRHGCRNVFSEPPSFLWLVCNLPAWKPSTEVFWMSGKSCVAITTLNASPQCYRHGRR